MFSMSTVSFNFYKHTAFGCALSVFVCAKDTASTGILMYGIYSNIITIDIQRNF